MKTFVLATAAILGAAAVPAAAQDAVAPDAVAPAADAGSSFTGPRAEFFGSWARGQSRNRADVNGTSVRSKSHKDSLIAGALGGYDIGIGDTLVVGAFGSYALNTARSCVNTPTLAGCLKGGRDIEGGARIGAKVGDKALVYAKGAYMNSRLRGRFAAPAGTATFGGARNLEGWRAGAGAEYALNQHLYTKIEYDYTRYGRFNATDLGLADTRIRQDRNQVMGGFGVRF